ncbi:MAG: ribose-5-phosphate isomerase RpiA [Gemmatales bacterium]
MTNVEKALQYVADGMVIGLGSRHASERFLHALADRIRNGLKIHGVPTSVNTEHLARQLGIPLTTLEETPDLDLAVDGADEFDPQLNLIKGYGHALVREKIVAAAAKKFIILVGPENAEVKKVDILGRRGKLPIEVVPFSLPTCQQQLKQLGLPAEPLKNGNALFVSDNGNYVLECKISPIPDAAALEHQLRNIPGIVDTGLFLGMADEVLFETGDMQVFKRP